MYTNGPKGLIVAAISSITLLVIEELRLLSKNRKAFFRKAVGRWSFWLERICIAIAGFTVGIVRKLFYIRVIKHLQTVQVNKHRKVRAFVHISGHLVGHVIWHSIHRNYSHWRMCMVSWLLYSEKDQQWHTFGQLKATQNIWQSTFTLLIWNCP